MRIKLIFNDWINKDGKSVYNQAGCTHLSMGQFHSGTMFNGQIDLDEDDRNEIRAGIAEGCWPVFKVMLK